MDPVSILGIVSAGIGIITGLARLGKQLYDAWLERKRKRKHDDIVRWSVAEQDPKEREHERLLQELAQALRDTAATTTTPTAAAGEATSVADSATVRDLQARAAALEASIQQRDAAVDEQLAQGVRERERWQNLAMLDLRHLSMPPTELLADRAKMRTAFRPLPEMNPDSQRYVVVIGPAGTGKSSLIQQLLMSHGYADLAIKLEPCTIGTGTSKPAPYIMDKHGVLLLDSVGNAAARVVQGEALAADVLVVFLGIHCRSEQILGDAAVIAYRLQHQMHTVLVVSHVDQDLLKSRSQQSAQQAISHLHHQMLSEVQRMLGDRSASNSVVCRAAEHQLQAEPGVASLLQFAEQADSDSWCEWMQKQAWLSTVCLGCEDAPGLQPEEVAVLRAERKRLSALICRRAVQLPLAVPKVAAPLEVQVLPQAVPQSSSPRRPQVLEGHTNGVLCCAITPDGRTLVSGSADKTLRLWDLVTGSCKHTLQGHTDWVYCCAISPDGRTLVSGSVDKTLRLWDLVTGSCKHTLQGHTSVVDCCAISPDGRTLVSGSVDNTLRLWDLVTGSCKHTLQGHTEVVVCCAISPDGRTLVSGSSDNTLRLWDLVTGSCKHTLQGHTHWVVCCAISPDGRTLVSGSYDKTLRLWDLVTGSCKHTLQGHTWGVYCCAITPDGRTLVSGSHDKTLRLWDLVTGSCKHTLQGHTHCVFCCAISPDGRTLVSGSVDSTLRLWDLVTGS